MLALSKTTQLTFGHFLASDFPKLESNKLMCVMRIHFCDYKFDYFLICGYDHVFIFYGATQCQLRRLRPPAFLNSFLYIN